VGNWVSEGLCEVWGDGRHKLPFVLVEDVAAALIRGMEVPGIEGRSYNLADIPLLSAHEYLDELQRCSGTKLDIRYRAIWRFYVNDPTKWLVKVAVGHPDKSRIPSYHDWESRTQKAVFDCSLARSELNWQPAGNRERLIVEGIDASLAPWQEARSRDVGLLSPAPPLCVVR
jgi:nucleoside-diphosphate-sugar epimerase